jgi:hypothetical protein
MNNPPKSISSNKVVGFYFTIVDVYGVAAVDMDRVSDVAAIPTAIDVPSANGVSNVSGVPAAAGAIANFCC